MSICNTILNVHETFRMVRSETESFLSLARTGNYYTFFYIGAVYANEGHVLLHVQCVVLALLAVLTHTVLIATVFQMLPICFLYSHTTNIRTDHTNTTHIRTDYTHTPHTTHHTPHTTHHTLHTTPHACTILYEPTCHVRSRTSLHQ